MDFALHSTHGGAGFFNRFIRPLQNRLRFGQKDFSRRRQPHGLGAAFQKREADFIFEVVDLPAQGRLRDVQFRRGARDIFRFSHGDEVTKMTEFHAAENNCT